MKVYGFTKDGHGFMEVDNTLKAAQDFVDGLIDVVELNNGLDVVCNDEGKFNGSEPRVAWIEDNELMDVIYGNCFVCRHNKEGQFVDVRENDEKDILKHLKDMRVLLEQ